MFEMRVIVQREETVGTDYKKGQWVDAISDYDPDYQIDREEWAHRSAQNLRAGLVHMLGDVPKISDILEYFPTYTIRQALECRNHYIESSIEYQVRALP